MERTALAGLRRRISDPPDGIGENPPGDGGIHVKQKCDADGPAELPSRPNFRAVIGELAKGSRTFDELVSACPERDSAEEDVRAMEEAGMIVSEDGRFLHTEFVRTVETILVEDGDLDAYLECRQALEVDAKRAPLPLYEIALLLLLRDGPMSVEEIGDALESYGYGGIGMGQNLDSIALHGSVRYNNGMTSLTQRGMRIADSLGGIVAQVNDDLLR